MDFFCDEPRRAPKPASLEQVILLYYIYYNPKIISIFKILQIFQIPSCELVPEVSIILPPNSNLGLQKKLPTNNANKLSYGAWKTQQQYASQAMTKPKCNKENMTLYGQSDCNDSAYRISSRKQVRFDSPSNCKEVLKINCDNNNSANVKNPPNIDIRNKPFEQIYMANIPNRHLDLSIIETPTYKPQENKINYPQNICETQKFCENFNKNCSDNKDIDSVLRDYSEKLKIDKKFDYPYQKFRDEYHSDNNHKTRQLECLSLHNERNYDRSIVEKRSISKLNDTNEDTTVKELLKVVQQQNEQILLLQKQVALLLQNQTNQKQIEQTVNDQEKGIVMQDRSNNNTKFEQLQYNQQQRHSKGPLSKFAIDVMTSFEVSIRRQENLNKENLGPKIQEITENSPNEPCNNKNSCDSVLGDIKKQVRKENFGKQENDLSLTLSGPLPVMERCVSPEHSVHVDMQDYSSEYVLKFYINILIFSLIFFYCSSDDESTCSSTDIGWTIYNNVMVIFLF